MGNQAKAAYDLGVTLGLASFQASVGQSDLALEALSGAQTHLDVLANANLVPESDIPHTTRHDAIVQLRQSLESSIRGKSDDLGNAYRLGLLMALAEGQTTSPEWDKAVSYARDALDGAREVLVENLQPHVGGFDIAKFDELRGKIDLLTASEDRHGWIQALRLEFGDDLQRTSAF